MFDRQHLVRLCWIVGAVAVAVLAFCLKGSPLVAGALHDVAHWMADISAAEMAVTLLIRGFAE